MLSKRIFEPAIPTLVVLFASVFSFGGVVYAQPVENPRPLSVNNQIIEQRTQEVEDKYKAVDSTGQTVNELENKKKSLQEQLEAEKQSIAELKQKIANKKAEEARRAQQARVVSQPVRTTSYAPPAPQGNCGDNAYAAYIYGMESGGRVPGNCNTTARNASGCYGIGQACPGSKVAHCGADYACQNAWFTNYAMQRYGSWASAYNFHKANGWW
jgi:hypothetical protein